MNNNPSYKFFDVNCNHDEIKIMVLLIITITIGLLLHIINWTFTGYPGINYLVKSPQRYFFPFMIALWWLAKRYHHHTPRLANITWFYTSYFLIYTSLGFLVNSVQYTPFSPIDPWLIQVDNLLNFNSVTALQWGHASPFITTCLQIAYGSLMWQLLIIPAIVFLYTQSSSLILRYFKQLLICGLAGMLIYYFLPTVGPAHYFESPYFSVSEHNTFLKFFEVHHQLPILSASGGIIAFPSFHVIWALLIILVARPIKWLFYPLLLLNTLLILSTLLLGWHYLVDVIASFILVFTIAFITR